MRPKPAEAGKLTRKQYWELKAAQGIKDKYADGVPLTGADHAFMLGLLRQHPRAQAKAGALQANHIPLSKRHCRGVAAPDRALTANRSNRLETQVILYHFTSYPATEAILASGFCARHNGAVIPEGEEHCLAGQREQMQPEASQAGRAYLRSIATRPDGATS